jgi:hypothetical protein
VSVVIFLIKATGADKRIDVTYPTNVFGATSYRATASEPLATEASATDTKLATAPNVGSAVLSGLVNDRDYLVEVVALAGTSVIAMGTGTARPTSPITIVSIVPGDKKLTVQYLVSPLTGASTVKVEAQATGAASGTATGGLPGGTVTVSGLDNDIEYTLLVSVLDAGTKTLASLEAKGTPLAPIVVTAVAGDARIDVSWVLLTPISGHAKYRVSVLPAHASSQTTTDITTISATFTGLTNGTAYQVKVEALNTAGSVLTSASDVAKPTSRLKVTALPGDKKITVIYSLTAPIPGLDHFELRTAPVTSTIVKTIQDVPLAAFTSLTNGTQYTITVDAEDASGNILSSETAVATPAGPVSLQLPPLDLYPLTVASLDSSRRRRAMLEARRVGTKWRYDHLRSQVLAAVDQASVFERELQGLVALDVAKNLAAQQLLPEYLLTLTSQLSGILGKVQQAPIPDVDDSVKTLADAINTFVLLQRLLEWLITNDALAFWVGIFDHLIDDISAFETELPRTRRYLRQQFGTDDIQAAITTMLESARSEIQGFVDDAVDPLRGGVGEAISSAASALQTVFQSFDEPLLVNAGGPGSGLATPTPLDTLSEQLLQAVDDVIKKVREEVERALELGLSAVSAAGLFEAIIVTYVLLPVLAGLVVAVAGGPVAAVALAIAVTIAAQELVHLLARWLAGPLRGQIEVARGKIEEALGLVREAIALPLAGTLAGTTPQPGQSLLWAAGQLGSIRDLLPEVYVERVAALLDEARDAVLTGAGDLALAAEQALGLENATVFDQIARRYESDLPPAPRLPGGVSGSAFAGAALVRDLGELERSRLHLFDGKESELTLRLSLFRELGGSGDPTKPLDAEYVAGEFARLLRGEEVAVQLREDALLQRGYPGIYRALIAEITARAIFATPLPASFADVNIPLQLLHLGVSRTRVKVGIGTTAIQDAEKWGPGTYLESDPDPEIGSLGFATFVRELPPEAVTMNLVLEAARTGASNPATGTLPASTLPLSRNAQYRPFENRGLEGTFLLTLPAAQTLALLGDTDAVFGGATTPRLLDIVLDVTLRACFDGDLAAAMRARRRQRRDLLSAASSLLGSGNALQVAGLTPRPTPSNSRTLHFSLRAHRDDMLRFFKGYLPRYQAAKQGLPTSGANWNAMSITEPLTANGPFKALPLNKLVSTDTTEMPKFALRFSATPSGIASGDDLAKAAREIVITPDVLGITADMLTQTPPGAGLVGAAVSVIPTSAGARILQQVVVPNNPPWGTGGTKDFALVSLPGETISGVLGGANGTLYASANQFGAWRPFASTGPSTAPTSKKRLALANLNGRLQAAVLDSAGMPYHAERSGAVWTPWAPFHSGLMALPAYKSIGLGAANGELHAVVTDAANKPWLTRKTVTGWSQWVDLLAPTAAGSEIDSFPNWTIFNATDATCVDRDGELYVFIAAWAWYTGSSGYYFPASGILYSVRRADGSWPKWRGLPAPGWGLSLSVASARIARDIHVCWVHSSTTSGNIYHSVVHPNGTTEDAVNVTASAGKPAPFARVSCAAVGGEVLLLGSTSTGAIYLTRRRSNGAWDPWQDITALSGVTIEETDPLASLTLLAGGALSTVMPTFATATHPGRLTISDLATPGAVPTLDFEALFADPTSRLELDLGGVLAQGLIYDVILSLTYAVPVQMVTPTS